MNEQPKAPPTVSGITQLIEVVRSSGAVLEPMMARLTTPKAASTAGSGSTCRPVFRIRLKSQPNSATAPTVTTAISQGLRYERRPVTQQSTPWETWTARMARKIPGAIRSTRAEAFGPNRGAVESLLVRSEERTAGSPKSCPKGVNLLSPSRLIGAHTVAMGSTPQSRLPVALDAPTPLARTGLEQAALTAGFTVASNGALPVLSLRSGDIGLPHDDFDVVTDGSSVTITLTTPASADLWNALFTLVNDLLG